MLLAALNKMSRVRRGDKGQKSRKIVEKKSKKVEKSRKIEADSDYIDSTFKYSMHGV